MNIHIEFCVKWNYGPEFDRVSKEIKEIFPHAIIKGNKNGQVDRGDNSSPSIRSRYFTENKGSCKLVRFQK